MEDKKFIQCGIMAMRDPKMGGFLPATPLYMEETPEVKESELSILRDFGKFIARKMKEAESRPQGRPSGRKKKIAVEG